MVMPDATVPFYSEAGHGDINPSNGTARGNSSAGLSLLKRTALLRAV